MPRKAVRQAKIKTSRKSADVMSFNDLESSQDKEKRIFRLKRLHFFILIILIGAVLLYTFKGFLIAATVNGQPISRLTIVSELEKQSGKQVLNSHVTKMLVLQEAKKKNITVSQDEIDNEIKKIEENLKKQNQKLDDVLTLQSLTRASLIEQIRLQKMVEKMVGKDIAIADKEVSDYIEKNKDVLGASADLSDEKKAKETKDRVKQQLLQQKLNEKIQALIESLQKNAKINYFVKY